MWEGLDAGLDDPDADDGGATSEEADATSSRRRSGAGRRLPEPPAVAVSLLRLLETTASRLLDRPPVPKLRLSPGGLARGEIDLLQVEVPALLVAGLVVDRLSVRGEHVRLAPGLPPHLRAGPVSFRAVVSQSNVDHWTRAARLPLQLRLTEEGVRLRTDVAGVRVGEVLAELDVAGPLLRLRPRQASILGLPTPLARFFRGYLPLPPLPRGARLRQVDTRDGEIAVTVVVDAVDEVLTPEVAQRLARALGLPLP